MPNSKNQENEVITTKGIMNVALLEKKEGFMDNENEYTTWIEYRLIGNDEVIHRSVHVTLKKNLVASAIATSF